MSNSKGRKNNDDTEEIEQGKCIQKTGEKTGGRTESSRPQRYCLATLAQLSSSARSYSTACHQCSPPPFRPCCGCCSAWSCDEREGTYLMQLP